MAGAWILKTSPRRGSLVSRDLLAQMSHALAAHHGSEAAADETAVTPMHGQTMSEPSVAVSSPPVA
jgi:hypothetical protein